MHRFNRGLFYWVGSRELLPDAWRLVAAASQHTAHANDDAVRVLVQSVIQRVARALEIRDALHLALNKPQNNDTLDLALSRLDVVLSLLMGALDPLARAAHRVLDIGTDEYQAAWQRPRWLSQVRRVSPGLADVVEHNTDGWHTLTILSLLRNSVHGEALRGVTFVEQADPQSLVALPNRDQDRVVEAIETLGGTDQWGVRAVVSNQFLMDPGILVDTLFTHVIRLLNALMAQIPVERLSHVALTPTDLEPPTSSVTGRSGAFDPWVRQSIRWQLGF